MKNRTGQRGTSPNKTTNMDSHNEPRPDERLFACILKRALLYQQDESTDTARYRSASPEYQITTRAWIDLDRAGAR